IYGFAFLLFSIGYLLISFTGSYPLIIFALLIAGAGTGLLMPNANLWMISIAPEFKRGQMVGNLTMAVFLGQFLSPIMVHPFILKGQVQDAFFYPGIIMAFIALGFFVERILFIRKQTH
ncbi:MAG: MFS transporter, partial [Ignavibacteria bacterium]|nr:MFS transporter [Ignavibacteria bacterium]